MLDAFGRDERAIEGLPIRLVIALVVGVACLGIMLNMLSGIQSIGITEVDVQPTPEVTDPGAQDVDVTVVEPDGKRIANATVIARGDTARLDGVVTARTNATGTATMTLDPTLDANQDDGTVSFDVQPPSGDEYVDRRGNTRLLVVDGA